MKQSQICKHLFSCYSLSLSRRSGVLSQAQNKVSEKSECVRTLATFQGRNVFGYGAGPPTTRFMQMQIVDALNLGERNKASNLLLNLTQGSNSLTANDFVHILNYCATSPDPLFVMETWRMMEEKEVSLNNRCSLLMVKALCEGGYLDEAFGFINFLQESNGINPILPVCNYLLGACAKLQNTMHSNQCLDMMACKMVGKNEVTYSVLLKLAVWQQNLSAVHEIWKDYVNSYSLSVLSLRKFIWSLSRLGDLKSAYETLQQMVILAISGSSLLRTARGKFCSSRLDIPIPSRGELYSKELELVLDVHSVPAAYSKNLESIATNIERCPVYRIEDQELVNSRPILLDKYKINPVMKVLRWSFSDVIHACAHSKDADLAEQLMHQMQSLGLQPSSHTYDGFVRAVAAERGFSDGIDVLKVMHQKNLKPRDSTLAALSISCSKALELDLAEDLLDQVSNCPYTHPFNAFLAACDTMGQPERAMRILAKMGKLKLLPDIRTYELLFSLFSNVNVPYEDGDMLSQADTAKRIHVIEMHMARNGVQHSHVSMKNLLKALGAEGMIREMLKYLHMAENLFCRNNTYLGTPIYNIVLHSLVKAKESHMAIEIFKDIQSSGFRPNAATYNIMIDCCSILGCFKSACGLVSLMIREGFCPQALTFTGLVKILLEHENFEESFSLLDQASSEEVQLDVIFFNTILQKAGEKGRIDIIEFIVERMYRVNIQPDSSTCHHVFSAYVDQGFHSTAVEALQVLSMRMLCEEGGSPLDKTLYEDAFVLSEDSEDESRIMEIFKESDVNLAVALLNLRWSAMVGFSVPLSPDQSPWARRLSNSYDHEKRGSRD